MVRIKMRPVAWVSPIRRRKAKDPRGGAVGVGAEVAQSGEDRPLALPKNKPEKTCGGAPKNGEA